MNEYHIDSALTSIRGEIADIRKRLDERVAVCESLGRSRDYAYMAGLQFALEMLEACYYEAMQSKIETERA